MIRVHMFNHLDQYEGFFAESDKMEVYYWWEYDGDKEYEFVGRFTLDGMYLKEVFIMSNDEVIVGCILDD